MTAMPTGARAVFAAVVLATWTRVSLCLPSSENRGFQDPSSPSVDNGSFLWRVNSVPPSFLFGTIHVPYTRVWDAVPENAKKAFYASREVYFELDLTNHATISELSACQLLPRGQHLSQLLPSDLYMRLKLHLERVRREMPSWLTEDQRGFDADYLFSTMTANWEKKHPIWVLLMISTLTKNDVASRGIPVLDLFLAQRANRLGKKVRAIEKVEEQCRPLNQLSLPEVIFALNQTLLLEDSMRLEQKSEGYETDNLIEQYRRGNLESSFFNQDTFQIPVFSVKEKLLTEEEKAMAIQIDRFFRDNLVIKRNKRMAARVVDLLVNRPESYFFAFGTGHFIGKYNILELIRSAGFKVEHVPRDADIGLGSRAPGKNTVQGTFDDLSEHEKTRALLQYLHYQQQKEREDDTKRFQDLVRGFPSNASTADSSPEITVQSDEKAVEESLKVWYGLSNASGRLAAVGNEATALAVIVALCSHFYI